MRLDTQPPLSSAEQRIQHLLGLYASAERAEHRISIMQDVAYVLESQLGDADAAWAALFEALIDDVEYAPVVAELERLSHELDRWGDLLERFIAHTRAAEDHEPETAAPLWVRLARWYDAPLGEREYARHALTAALRCDEANADARRLLARFAREAQDWHELAHQLGHLARVTELVTERRDAHLELAGLYEGPLFDRERALASYRAAVASGADAPAALEALERIYREAEQWRELIDVLSARAERAASARDRLRLELERARLALVRLGERRPAQVSDWRQAVDVLAQVAREQATESERADVWWQRGDIERRELGDADAAEHSFAEALVHDPAHLRSLRALVELYEDRGDWAKAARYAADAARACDDAASRARLFSRAAMIAQHHLRDDATAIRYFELVHAHDPDDLEALIALGELYLRCKRWSDARPVLERLATGPEADELDAELRAQLLVQTGMCAIALGDATAAIAHFGEACAFDPACDEARERLADVLYERGEWSAAATAYEGLCEGVPEIEAAPRVKLARCHRELGDSVKALVAYHGALRVEPRCRDALAGISEVHFERGEWVSAARAKRAQLRGADDEERWNLLRELAALERDYLVNLPAAIDAFRDAAAIRPLPRADLQSLLDLYAETGRWADAVAVIETFVDRESDAARRAAYLVAAAVIHRDERGDVDSAVACYERALDAYFPPGKPVPPADREARFKPFAALDALLTEQRDWPRQRLAYRAMIHRLPPGDPVLPPLWHALGEICRTRLRDYEAAIEAFEVAQVLAPEPTRATILRELRALRR